MTTHPYDELYFEDVQTEMGVLFYIACTARQDFSSVEDFASAFKLSKVAHGFEVGHLHYIAGTCGIEWYVELLQENGIAYEFEQLRNLRYSVNNAYWCGWVIAYYHWTRNVSFSQILQPGVLTKLFHAYEPLHTAEFVPIEAAKFLDSLCTSI